MDVISDQQSSSLEDPKQALLSSWLRNILVNPFEGFLRQKINSPIVEHDVAWSYHPWERFHSWLLQSNWPQHVWGSQYRWTVRDAFLVMYMSVHLTYRPIPSLHLRQIWHFHVQIQGYSECHVLSRIVINLLPGCKLNQYLSDKHVAALITFESEMLLCPLLRAAVWPAVKEILIIGLRACKTTWWSRFRNVWVETLVPVAIRKCYCNRVAFMQRFLLSVNVKYPS